MRLTWALSGSPAPTPLKSTLFGCVCRPGRSLRPSGPAARTLGRWRPPSACGGGNAAAAARFVGELNGVAPSFAPAQQVSHIDGTAHLLVFWLHIQSQIPLECPPMLQHVMLVSHGTGKARTAEQTAKPGHCLYKQQGRKPWLPHSFQYMQCH